jgi:hypothetical protein
MRTTVWIVAGLMTLGAALMAAAAVDAPNALNDEVLRIIRTKFADAVLVPDKDYQDTLRFSHNLREFTIYRLNKTGDWQKPFASQGPDRGGLFVRFYVKKGKWEGALKIPYTGTTDLYVFQETHMVKESADGTRHIWAEILTPRVDAPDKVKDELVKVFQGFEKYQK